VTVLVGCGSDSSGGPAGSGGIAGADDVLSACVIRAGWSKGTTSTCLTCISLADNPACSCSGDPNSGKCASLNHTLQNEPDCTASVTSCVGLCMATDCACINGCYAGHDRCRAAASALDGCQIDVCDSTCR
jgi:hypothetical protein